jgi:flagellar biosynthetic protein FliQ
LGVEELMDADAAIDLARQAVTLILVVGAPVLGVALVVGLVVSILQTVTQVQDLTLAMVPKIVAALVTIALVGPWMLERLVEFSREMFSVVP